MHNKGFEKETFKETVRENIKTLYRKTIDEATPQQIFQAVSYAVKDVIIDDWIATQKAYDEADAKTVYYMSMEFLMGRALGNNLINLTAYKEVKEALEEMEIDLNVIEDQEPELQTAVNVLNRPGLQLAAVNKKTPGNLPRSYLSYMPVWLFCSVCFSSYLFLFDGLKIISFGFTSPNLSSAVSFIYSSV